MKGTLRKTLLTFLLLLSLPVIAAAEPALPMDGKSVLAYLDRMIDWRHRAVSVEAPYAVPQELLFRSDLQDHTVKSVRAGFDLARALAAMADEPPKAEEMPGEAAAATSINKRGIGQALIRAQQRLTELQRDAAAAKDASVRASIEGQIRLEQEHLNLLKTISTMAGASDESSQNLLEKIQQLSTAVPDGESEAKPAGPETIVAAPAPATAPTGIAGLAGRIWDLMRERSALRGVQAETKALSDENRAYSLAVRAAVQYIMKRGDEFRANAAGLSATQRAEQSATYDRLLVRMKQYSAVAVALSRVNLSLRACDGDLSDWIDLVSQRIGDLTRVLAWRAAILAVLIALICGLSVLAGGATKRYVLDERRRTLLRTLRRTVLGVAIAVTVFISFFTDFGSLATFAGLLTAGIAVSMQSVILSGIAYFNFFGPFGIKLGDRITVAGVTGKVIQITPLRFNLMELRDSDLGYLPSGRVVGFSNAILFQPTPFFRQTANTNFVWSEISLTLDPTVDYEETYKKLSAVVSRVYARHTDIIKRQEAAFEHLTKFKTEVSVPQTYLKITGTGIVMVIRYAVQREHEKDLQLEMTRELLATIKKDPDLKFVNIS